MKQYKMTSLIKKNIDNKENSFMNLIPNIIEKKILLLYCEYNEISKYSLVCKEWNKILKELLREIYELFNSFTLDLFQLVLLEKVDMIIYGCKNKLLDYYDIRRATDNECSEKVVQEFINEACTKLIYYAVKHKMFQILCYTPDRNQNIENYKKISREFNNIQKIGATDKRLIYLNKRKKIKCYDYKRKTSYREMCIVLTR
jgi:hypothetical protein